MDTALLQDDVVPTPWGQAAALLIRRVCSDFLIRDSLAYQHLFDLSRGRTSDIYACTPSDLRDIAAGCILVSACLSLDGPAESGSQARDYLLAIGLVTREGNRLRLRASRMEVTAEVEGASRAIAPRAEPISNPESAPAPDHGREGAN